MSINKSKETKHQVKSDVVAQAVESVKEPTVNFTRFMVGTYIDPVRGEWMIAYAPFDPSTKTIGEFKSERVAGDLEVMRERLTIKLANLGIYEAADIKEERKMEMY